MQETPAGLYKVPSLHFSDELIFSHASTRLIFLALMMISYSKAKFKIVSESYHPKFVPARGGQGERTGGEGGCLVPLGAQGRDRAASPAPPLCLLIQI